MINETEVFAAALTIYEQLDSLDKAIRNARKVGVFVRDIRAEKSRLDGVLYDSVMLSIIIPQEHEVNHADIGANHVR